MRKQGPSCRVYMSVSECGSACRGPRGDGKPEGRERGPWAGLSEETTLGLHAGYSGHHALYPHDLLGQVLSSLVPQTQRLRHISMQFLPQLEMAEQAWSMPGTATLFCVFVHRWAAVCIVSGVQQGGDYYLQFVGVETEA